MSFAIIRTGGKQFTVEPGATLRVPTLETEVGSSLDLEVGSSRVDLQACKLEYSIVSPK